MHHFEVEIRSAVRAVGPEHVNKIKKHFFHAINTNGSDKWFAEWGGAT
jgi:hypothetical protein